MRKLSKDKMLASMLLSASTIGMTSINSEGFSGRYVVSFNNLSNNTIRFSNDVTKEINEMEPIIKKYIKIDRGMPDDYKQIILLTLTGIWKDNSNFYKSILKALEKTGGKLEIKYLNKKDCLYAGWSYPDANGNGNPIIKLNKSRLANSMNVQEVLCHEIGHILWESILINNGIKSRWKFNDEYFEIIFGKIAEKYYHEYAEIKKEFRRTRNISKTHTKEIFGDYIKTATRELLTKYGIKSKDDTEMFADWIAYYLLNEESINKQNEESLKISFIPYLNLILNVMNAENDCEELNGPNIIPINDKLIPIEMYT